MCLCWDWYDDLRPYVLVQFYSLALIPLLLAVRLWTACSGDAPPVNPQPTASPEAEAPAEPLKLGFLVDFSGPLADYGPELLRGVELAVDQLNAAGGVWGMPVELAVGDTALDPTIAVEEARRLIEVEGVHGLVGPMSSAMALAVAESVSGSARIPTISPVATSSQVTLADDDDFLFRVSLADRVEGRYLADLTTERGYTNVALLYRDDAFGQGMAVAFEAHYGGTLASFGINPGAPSFIAELEQAAAQGAEALVLIGFPPETILIVREALELNYFDQFIFGAPSRSPALPAAIGAEPLAGMPGTYVAAAPENDASRIWTADFLAEHEALPQLPYVKEAYDATIALALAAQAAASTDGGAIRDQLRPIGGSGGLVVIPGVESLREGLTAAASGEAVNYQGASGDLEWDEHGDSTSGYIGIWQFTETGGLEDTALYEFNADAEE